MPGHCHSNLDPDLVDQVNPGKDGLIGPLGHDVLLNPDLPPLRVEGPSISNTKPMEPRGGFLAVLLVEQHDPRVQLLDGVQHVPVVPGGVAVVLKPNISRGIIHCGNHKFVFGLWVLHILFVDHLLEVHKAVDDVGD